MEFFRDDQWRKIYQFLRIEGAVRRIYPGPEKSCKKFINAVFWMTRSGAPWRFLPKEYGDWNAVYKRFSKWSDSGVFHRMFAHFKEDADMSSALLDSTIVRAHACAAGASKKNQSRL